MSSSNITFYYPKDPEMIYQSAMNSLGTSQDLVDSDFMQRIAIELSNRGQIETSALENVLKKALQDRPVSFHEMDPFIVPQLLSIFKRSSLTGDVWIQQAQSMADQSLDKVNGELVSHNPLLEPSKQAKSALEKASDIVGKAIKKDFPRSSDINPELFPPKRSGVIKVPEGYSRVDVLEGLEKCSDSRHSRPMPYDARDMTHNPKNYDSKRIVDREEFNDRDKLEEKLKTGNTIVKSSGIIVRISFEDFPYVNVGGYIVSGRLSKTPKEILRGCILDRSTTKIKVPAEVSKEDVIKGLANCSNRPGLYAPKPPSTHMIKKALETEGVIEKVNGDCIETSLEDFPELDLTNYVHRCDVNRSGENILNQCILERPPTKQED